MTVEVCQREVKDPGGLSIRKNIRHDLRLLQGMRWNIKKPNTVPMLMERVEGKPSSGGLFFSVLFG